jgi:tetratricopeptide (TPR) repeat protein
LILQNLFKRLGARLAGLQGPAVSRPASLLAEGMRLQSVGDDAGAEACYRRALHANPVSADANFLLGSLLGKLDRVDGAKQYLAAAIAARADFAEAHAAIGNLHLMQRDYAAAQSCYDEALRLQPDNPLTHFNLGLLAQCRLDARAALGHFERAWALSPTLPGLLKNLTLARLQCGQFEQAVTALQRMVEQRPQDAELSYAMAIAEQQMHHPQRALEYFARAEALGETDPELPLKRGLALRDLGRLDEALACFEAVLGGRPGDELALWHRSLLYLLQQDFVRGWQHYDLRLRSVDRPQPPRILPQWTGEDPAMLGLLVHGEQGLGDEIMFASCLPELIVASRRCVVECSSRLVGLFSRSFPTAVVRTSSPVATAAAGQGLDRQIALGSLPQHLRKIVADFPRHHGYLRADPARVEVWRRRFGALGPGPAIGISWRGGTHETRSPLRSLPLEQWAPIFGVDGVHFIDLQYTDCGPEIDIVQRQHAVRIHRWAEARADFEETAALVAALDLVVSVCTTVIHLAGALGKPVWVMAPYAPEWRYGMRGHTMPWYPSARIFRQPAYGEWQPVIEDVAQSMTIWRDGYAETPDHSSTGQPPHR